MRFLGWGNPDKSAPPVIDEISPERRDEILDYVVRKIADFGMITPAIIVLEGYSPLSYIASQGVHFLAPFGDILFGGPYVSEIGFLMQDRKNLEMLIERLEAMSEEEQREQRERKKRRAERQKADRAAKSESSEEAEKPDE